MRLVFVVLIENVLTRASLSLRLSCVFNKLRLCVRRVWSPDTLYRVAFVLAQNGVEHLFTHKSGDFSAISVSKRSCAALISKWSVTYRIGSLPHFGVV